MFSITSVHDEPLITAQSLSMLLRSIVVLKFLFHFVDDGSRNGEGV